MPDALKLAPPPPDKAPLLYKDRGEEKDGDGNTTKFRNPGHFVLVVYAPYLGIRDEMIGMEQKDLVSLDEELHGRVAQWRTHCNEQSPDFIELEKRLPTTAARTDEIVRAILAGRGVPDLTMEKLVYAFAAIASRMRRRIKKKKIRVSKDKPDELPD